MQFSTMVLTMYVDVDDTPEADERILGLAIEQSLLAAELGYHPFFTEHHFRGPWHSNPLQFAAYLAPQLPDDIRLGFGVLSLPYYHPVRLAEGMNLLDQLTKGRALFGVGSGFPGIEPPGMGISPEHHGSSRAADEALEVLQHLWSFRNGDPAYEFQTEAYRARIVKRVVPGPYRKPRPTIIATARRDAALIRAARNGWPAFLGTWGDDAFLVEQLRTYRTELAQANHPQEVVAECLQWCTYDWLAVVVAETDELAVANARAARQERLAMRNLSAQRSGRQVHGPVAATRGAAKPPADAFAGGGDMDDVAAGSPETIAKLVGRFAELGMNHLLVRFMGEWTGETRSVAETSMRLFAAEVMPRFKHVPPLQHPLALDLSGEGAEKKVGAS